MARPVDIREESGISTFRARVLSDTLSAVLCMAMVLVKLETGRDMVGQVRIAENARRFIR